MIKLPEDFDPEVLKASLHPQATQSLFLETAQRDKSKARLSLGVLPKEGYVWFKPIYIHYTLEDTTEYTLATKIFHSWRQWERISKNRLVLDFLEPIRAERDVAIKSELFKAIMEEATSGRSKLQAAKYLIESGLQPEESPRSARKSRKRLDEAAKVSEDTNRIHSETLKRIGIYE